MTETKPREYSEWWCSLPQRAQDAETARLVKIAVWMFEPETLHPSSDGDVILCHPDIPRVWTTTGCDGETWSVSLDGRQDSWPLGEVFDPYDLRKLVAYLLTGSIPVLAHQDPEHEVRRVKAALEGSWGLPPLPALPTC